MSEITKAFLYMLVIIPVGMAFFYVLEYFERRKTAKLVEAINAAHDNVDPQG